MPIRFTIRLRSSTRGRTRALAMLCLALADPVFAAPGSAPAADEVIAGWVRGELQRGSPRSDANPDTPATRIEIRVGAPDPRLTLAPCQRIEPFLLAGVRLWGSARIGIRCVEGAHWSTTLPVQVEVHGPALVARATLPAGAAVSADDFTLEQRALTRESGSIVGDPTMVRGKILARPLTAGQVLKADGLRQPMVFVAGDPVRIRINADGFTISAEGIALNPAAEGQPIRVRTENGRVVSGTVRDRGIDLRM